MFKTINVYDFRDEFKAMGRGDQFTYDGLQVLFDHLESYDHMGDGSEYELDVIALCCDFSEGTPREIAQNYGLNVAELSDTEAMQAVIDALGEEGALVGATNTTIVYQQF